MRKTVKCIHGVKVRETLGSAHFHPVKDVNCSSLQQVVGLKLNPGFLVMESVFLLGGLRQGLS
ncbi:MAG: hypothetical protein O3C32_03405 [Bacteroidetes bacterium]|nr:hypothetical protein [Bacteroidota bacterium]